MSTIFPSALLYAAPGSDVELLKQELMELRQRYDQQQKALAVLTEWHYTMQGVGTRGIFWKPPVLLWSSVSPLPQLSAGSRKEPSGLYLRS